jgi:hypothetical protein
MPVVQQVPTTCAQIEHPADSLFDRHPDCLAVLVVGLGFVCRAWLAHATFFNTDEAWHFSVANQDSLRHAYQASLTIWHPPLLIIVLYFWKFLGTSDLMLRMPDVIAGSVFCWFYYRWLKILFGLAVAWVGLLLVTFLPTMIAMSAELRQYPLLLMFLATAAYCLELAFTRDSVAWMLLFSGCLWLAMLTHYSAVLFAAAIGIYAIFRIFRQKCSRAMIAAWIAAQLGGLALAYLLYTAQITKLRIMYGGAQPLHRFAEWYLPQFYYDPRHDHLIFFLLSGTFGIFRFIFSWVVIGYLATLLFVAGAVLLLRDKSAGRVSFSSRLSGILLLLPFVVSWVAVAAGLYPFGRTRHSIFLVMFAIAGVSVALVRIAKRKIVAALTMTAGIILLCHVFGTQPWHDMLPLADSRRANMDQAMELIRREVSPADVIYVNKSSEFQLAHYLCDRKPVNFDRSVAGFESFQCHGVRVISSFPNDDAVAIETFPTKWREMARAYSLKPGTKVWIFEGGWSRGFAEELKSRYPEFAGIQARNFGRYLQIFSLTVPGVVSLDSLPA